MYPYRSPVSQTCFLQEAKGPAIFLIKMSILAVCLETSPVCSLCVHTKRDMATGSHTKWTYRRVSGTFFWFVAPHFRRAQASAFTRICGATNSLEVKYFNFDTNFAWWQPISVQQRGHWVTCVCAGALRAFMNARSCLPPSWARPGTATGFHMLLILGHVGRLHFIIPAMRACNRPMSGYSRLTWTLPPTYKHVQALTTC